MLDMMEPFHNFLVDGIDAFAEATWAFIKGAFSAGAMTEEWWATVVGGEITINIGDESTTTDHPGMLNVVALAMIRSEERRVGKEWRALSSPSRGMEKERIDTW